MQEVGGVSLGPVGQGLLSQWRARSSLEASPSRLHVTRFHATPPLPTYVLGFWVGHFERLAVGQGPELRMAVPPGRGAEAGFAADWAARALGFYSQLLDMRLPLSKVDVLALPVMQGVGMEGFGAITVQQEYCLVGPHTDPLRRRRIAR
jgi:alanyl aminopeptidase